MSIEVYTSEKENELENGKLKIEPFLSSKFDYRRKFIQNCSPSII